MASKTILEVRNLASPDARREMGPGELEIVNLATADIVRAVFQPGWIWSKHAGPLAGTPSCQVAHTGYVLSGHFHVRMDDGREWELAPGDAHVVGPGHDAWVVGDEPCVIIDFATTKDSHAVMCPCGVEFRVHGEDQLEHLVAALREHASSSHGHELTREEILAEVAES